MLENLFADRVSLNGDWEFSLGERLFNQQIIVPGAWEAQGHSMYVDGPAWYRKTFTIPSAWHQKRIFLAFEAVSYACQIWFNGERLGAHVGLWTPFSFDVSQHARFGERNIIELEVFKPGERYPMRASLAGFLPDVATAFGGIWQDVSLQAFDLALEDVWARTDLETASVAVNARVAGALLDGVMEATARVRVWDGSLLASEAVQPLPAGAREIALELPITEPKTWSPQTPALYRVEITFEQDGKPAAAAERRVGFRSLVVEGERVLLNGVPVMLRGALSWGWNADAIAPLFTEAQIREEFRVLRAMGFNLVKLCLFLPDQRYLRIADEEGMLLWEEFPMWLPQITPEMRAQAPIEYADYMRLTREHPSVVLYSMGCELQRNVEADFVKTLMQIMRANSRGALICDNSGSGESYGGDFDFADFKDYHPYYDLQHFEPLLDHWRRDWQQPRPWIFGEFSDSDGFRDFDALLEANGGEKPWWMTAQNPVTQWRPESIALLRVEELMERTGLKQTAGALNAVAAKQSYQARKFTLEALRRRAGICGYVVTGLIDTPIATSGVLDDFGHPKWAAEAFHQINADAVLVLDGPRKRRWLYGGDRPAQLDLHNFWAGEHARWHVILSHFGPEAPSNGVLRWRLTDAGETVPGAQGAVVLNGVYRADGPSELAVIDCPLPVVDQARGLRLWVNYETNGLLVRNDWPVWIYPQIVALPGKVYLYDPSYLLGDWRQLEERSERVDDAGQVAREGTVVIATAVNEGLRSYLKEGGNILFLQQGNGPLPARRMPFYRESLKLFYPHAVWERFGTPDFADMQFFGLAADCALEGDRISDVFTGVSEIRPLMQRLDERMFEVSDYLFEARVGQGRLLACSLRLQGGAGSQPADLGRNVAGWSLLNEMLCYLLQKH
ncbi:MAG: hypothetical protein JW750_06370 [Anaerolineaceae bacterium]|nr:hypothetical protein [Anaerolineaceae bacterium]